MNYDAFTKYHPGRGHWRERMTLDQAMDIVGASWIGRLEPHIVFDPTVKHQYRVIRTQTHDGTTMFTPQLLMDTLLNLFRQNSYYTPMGPPPDGYLPHYTIGHIRHALVFGMVDLPAGRYPGCRESFVIPVRCEYRPQEA